MATFLEGVESISLLCSLVVLVPAVLLVLTAPARRVWLIVAFTVGTATMTWARAGRLWDLDANGTARWIIGAAIVATYALGHQRLGGKPLLPLTLGLAAGAIAGWLWQPCVGEQFAEVLNTAETDRVESLVKMHAYVIGLLLPAALITVLPHAAPRARVAMHHLGLRRSALIVAVVYGIAVAAGWYDDLVSELFRISAT